MHSYISVNKLGDALWVTVWLTADGETLWSCRRMSFWFSCVRVRSSACFHVESVLFPCRLNSCGMVLKEWLTRWINICWKCPHLQAIILYVDEFVSSSGFTASVSQQWMLCSEWVPSEWESDKNITIIHSTPVHQLTSGEDKRWALRRF